MRGIVGTITEATFQKIDGGTRVIATVVTSSPSGEPGKYEVKAEFLKPPADVQSIWLVGSPIELHNQTPKAGGE
jgi:hypothetical protein